jgi:hypothetical protein
MKRFLFLILINITCVLSTVATVYFVGWNYGYDQGLISKQDDDIIRGIVSCHYITEPTDATTE